MAPRLARPTFASPIPKGTDYTPALVGSQMLGLPLQPQGIRVACLLEARARAGTGVRYPEVVIQIPRQATKTTSIWATIIGRATLRYGYRCVVTAQSGNVASRILLEHANLLIANGQARYSQEKADPTDPRAVVYRNGGRERIEFPATGSAIWVVPPDAGAVRSAAADDIVIDEAGEFDGPKGKDFLDAVRPLQDTRGPLAQLIVTGTPGKSREGMFWEMLQLARSGKEKELGILDYSARDDEDPDDRKVWRRVHPGPSSVSVYGGPLTPMRVLEKRRKSMDVISWSREYLCVWPTDASTSALDLEAWRTSGTDFPDERPKRSVIAVETPKDQTCTAVVEVWRDDDGKACIELLAFRPGVTWAARFAYDEARKSGSLVVIDEIGGGNTGTAQALRKFTRPPIRLQVPKTLHVGAAAQHLANELREGRVRHFDQSDLTAAVESVAWRPLGRDGRAFMRKAGGGEIAPIVAASHALWAYDQTPARRSVSITSAAV